VSEGLPPVHIPDYCGLDIATTLLPLLMRGSNNDILYCSAECLLLAQSGHGDRGIGKGRG